MSNEEDSIIVQCLETLEDTTLYTKNSHVKCFQLLKCIFDDGGLKVTSEHVQRILTIFANSMKEYIACLPHAIATISSLFTNVKIIANIPTEVLLPSALSLLHMLKTLFLSHGTDKLRELGLELFVSYPGEVLGTIVTCHSSDLMEIFEVYRPKGETEIKISKEVCVFLHKLLTKLPLGQKKQFVNDGIQIWFSDLIPSVMHLIGVAGFEHTLIYLECLETLADVLVLVEYFHCVEWKSGIFPDICDSEKYPHTIIIQLKSGSDIWHRVWIVIVKLLKNQITRNCAPYGTPINLLLPVVELAYKMDANSRCRAFQCWNTLIDTFSTETNENCLPKRIKLLLLPLTVNNAKTEATALTKFQTWWHLITKFQYKFDKYTNEILIAFIHFAFGKDLSEKKQALFGVSQLYDGVKLQCLQAFAQIVGHGECDCCTDLPRLNGKLMNTKLLASNWNDWIFALKGAIKLAYTIGEDCESENPNNTTLSYKLILYIWKAFVFTIADLPPNGVRTDMFHGLIQVLNDFIEICQFYDNFSVLLFSLSMSIFDEEEKTRHVLITGMGEEKLPLQKIVSLITCPVMLDVYNRYDTEILMDMLKPLTNLIVESDNTDWLIENLPSHVTSSKLWTALVHSVKGSKLDIGPKTLKKLLAWPVHSMHLINEDKNAAMVWCTMYSLVSSLKRICNMGLDKDIVECITTPDKNNKIFFRLCLTMCLLKNKLLSQEDGGVLSEVLQNLTSKMDDYKEFEQAVPMLIDTIVVMLNNVTVSENVWLAKIALNCVKHILRVIISDVRSYKHETVTPIDANIYVILKNMLNAVGLLFKIPVYSDINSDFVDELREQAMSLNKESSLYTFITNHMKSLSVSSSDTVINQINNSILLLNQNDSDGKNKIVKEFTSPEVKKVKKAKKKEPSILNTVVENGEEYVVVKSNWKFNPRKLTENQKEKFQRKREDIPALYQDLSQSQDEFKLSTWKTDSQDTSSNSKSSKSTTKDDVSIILKNMPSADVVPSIMENIMSEKDENHISKAKTQNLKSNCSSKIDTPSKVDRSSLSTPKHHKSPRMALKDRIFRNVRNLIEKSSPKKECQTNECQIENVTRTPVIISDNDAKICNSAPSSLPADRPHRLKRKPRKFDDAELFGLKKRHYSQNEFQPNSSIDTYLNASTNESDSDHSVSVEEIKVRRESTIMDREIVETFKTVECNENSTTVQDVPELDAATVTQDDSIKGTLNEATTENCNIINNKDNVPDLQEHDDSLIIQQSHQNLRNGNVQICDKNGTTQDSLTKVEAEDIKKVRAAGNVNENNVTVEVNNEIEKKNEQNTAVFETPVKKNKEATQNSTTKKSSTRKSRIEKELAIDMVVGHPFLKVQSEKRLTRKQITNLAKSNRRKILNDNPIKKKLVTKTSPKPNQKSKEKVKLTLNNLESTNVTVEETQERSICPEAAATSDEDAPCSEDVIESSQDTTFTNITVNRISKLQPIVAVERINVLPGHSSNTGTQDLLQESDYDVLPSVMNEDVNHENKDDTEFSQNKTAEGEKNQSDLTENMDTEPAPDDNSLVVIVIDDDSNKPRVARNTTTVVCAETQELAEADTQPNDAKDFVKFDTINISSPVVTDTLDTLTDTVEDVPVKTTLSALETRDDIEILEPNESLHACNENDTEVSSPFKHDAQRMKDFLNNTSEISPIKVQSPDRDKISSTQEISSDYMVVKLTSPVQSNGEPFDKSSSLELLTGDKVSPDKRDMSPPRVDVTVNTGSPSSNLSLKKNRPQALRPSGRAAHMLGLCVPDSLNTIRNLERVEPEEPLKGSTSTPARRNLRILYNADNGDNISESESHNDNFLKFKKDLPPTDSPSIPILKRKHIDIVDETTASPAGKKKRVSFHDPPVSTTVSVQKYIEPSCIKSPSSASKRLERLMTRSYSKPPKRLENTFVKLDTVLSKAVESFTEEQADSLTNDTTVSLDITPVAEVVNTSELNDIDPICPELVACNDPIVNIAVELSSPAMKDLLIKELEGKVCTVGDLAKMTELEVNRLCIKAPKVQMAKRVLKDYVNKRMLSAQEVLLETIVLEDDCTSPTVLNEEIIDLQPKTACIETQTNVVTLTDALVQTRTEIVKLASTQTIIETLIDASMQTVESGSKATCEVIKTCLAERDDFVDRLSEQLEEAPKRKISEKLPTGTIIDILASKCDDVTPKLILHKVFERLNQNVSNSEGRCKELAFINDYLCTRFDSRELVLFCSQLLQKVYDKPA